MWRYIWVYISTGPGCNSIFRLGSQPCRPYLLGVCLCLRGFMCVRTWARNVCLFVVGRCLQAKKNQGILKKVRKVKWFQKKTRKNNGWREGYRSRISEKGKKKSRISEEGIKNQGFQKEVKNQGFQKKG